MKPNLHILSLGLSAILLASCANPWADNRPRREKHRDDARYNNTDNLDKPPTQGESDFLKPPDNTPANPGTPDGNTVVTTPPTNPPESATPPVTPPGPTAPPSPPKVETIPYGKPVPGKKGFVTSPFNPDAGMIDVRELAPGTKVKDPYDETKVFRVP